MLEISTGTYRTKITMHGWNGAASVSCSEEHIVPAILDAFDEMLIPSDEYWAVDTIDIINTEVHNEDPW